MAAAVGIEIGPAMIRAARLERSGGQLRLLAAEEQPYDPAQADGLGRALAQVRRSLGITQPVILGVPGFSAILSTVSALVVSRPRAALAVEFELQQQLPFELAQAAWHYQWLQSGARDPSQQTAVAAVMRQPLLEERLTVCRRAGIQVAGVSITAVALLNACYLHRSLLRAKALTVFHGIEAAAGEWIVWSPQRLQVVPVSAASPELLPQEAAASWRNLQAQWPDASPSLWIAGADAAVTAALSGLPGVQVQRLDLAQAVVMRAGRPEAAERAAAAVGLALQGLGAARLQLNLLEQARRVQGHQWVRRACAAIAIVGAAATLVLGVSGMLEVRRQRMELLGALERRERVYQRLRPEIRAMLQHQQRTERLTAQLRGVGARSSVLAETLGRIVAALPDGVWLTKVECVQNPAAAEVTLEGRAASFQEVTKLLDRLKGLEGMSAVKPLSTNVVAPAAASAAPGHDAASGELVAFAVQVQRALP